MVSMKVDKGSVNLRLKGSLVDITSEILFGIDKIHEQIKETDENSAETFKGLMSLGLFKIFDSDGADELVEELRKIVEEEDEDEDEDDDEDVLDEVIELLTKAKKAVK